jgi:two-component system, chemotaxis family, sensor kinase CheA
MAGMPRERELLACFDQLATQLVMGDRDETARALAELGRHLTHENERRAKAALDDLLQSAFASGASAQTEWDAQNRAAFESSLEALKRLALGGPTGNTAAKPSTSTALNQDPELVADFVMESREHLGNVEAGVLVLEKEPTTAEVLNSVFRSFHTIKGLAGFLEFEGIQSIAHEIETILDLARTGKVYMKPELIDLVLESADFVGSEINRIEAALRGESELAAGQNLDLLARVRVVIQRETTGEEPVLDKPVQAAPVQAVSVQAAPVEPPREAPKPSPQQEKPLPKAEIVIESAAEAAPGTDVASGAEAGTVARKKAPPQEVHAIRVDTAKLDYLLDMVGEMVIAESMVRLDPDLSANKNARLQRNLNQLRRVTEEVQKVAMATRLQPVGTLFQRVNRLVRDTARKAGKQADVELIGEDTQLDKTIIEELTDPIMHMVRNSIDHGIEPPQERLGNGKPAAGCVQLKAYRQADHIQLEIVDDGRGLNKAKILKKARERGLVGDNIQMTDSEIFQLIFEPGFSTADQVTDISGRGVGMDVVKRQIQKLRGKIEIQSTPGQGTTFFLKLPLTLAIIEGLVVGVGRERYILPIYSVQEMFRPAADQISTVQGRGEMVMVRNQLLPLIRLYRSLGMKPKFSDPVEGLMIVAETEGRRFALMVDEFIGKQEVVIKNLGESLKNTKGVAGGAILGDGRVGLILDLEGIYADRSTRTANGEELLANEARLSQNRESILGEGLSAL